MWLLLLACHPAGEDESPDSGPDTAAEADSDSGSEETAAEETEESRETAESEAPCNDTAPWYADADGDGFGGEPVCSDEPGATQLGWDCDDLHASSYPGATELRLSGRDDNCDGWGATTRVTGLRNLRLSAERDVWDPYLGPSTGLQVDVDSSGDAISDLMAGGDWYESDDSWHAGAVIFYSPLSSGGQDVTFATADARVSLPGGVLPQSTLLLRDTDGDGSSELLLGAQVSSYHPQIYLLPGPISAGTTQLDESHLVAEKEENSHLQYRLVAPGDMDHDGLAEMVLSDQLAADNGGEIYIFRGPLAGRGLADADTLLHGTPGTTSGAPYDGLGADTTDLGDLDGDGLSELGDMGSEGGNIFYDPPLGIHDYEDVATLISTTSGGKWAPLTHISGVGDMNGDGHRDIAMPTPANPYMLILFGPFPESETRSLWDDWDLVLYGDNWGLGMTDIDTITTLGDWDGDGYEDFAVNNRWAVRRNIARHCEPQYSQCLAGAAFLVAGPVQHGFYDLEHDADRINPPGPSQGFAEDLAGGADLDLDGAPDLAISSLAWDSVFVVFGGGFE